MKNSRIKNLISSHGWLGVIFSVVLFLVFWAGSISFFRYEIQQWAELPHHGITQEGKNMPVVEVIEKVIKDYPFDRKEHLNVVMPSSERPYYRLGIDLIESEAKQRQIPLKPGQHSIRINVNPKTGEMVGYADQFKLARFIYLLHRNLDLSRIGTYFVGFVTLFFLFALFSGIFIHAKKIIRLFFAYRIEKLRTQLLDFHNVVGVISFPFTLMYAISGLILNIIIVYQIGLLLTVYQGDTKAMFKDAGFSQVEQPEYANKPLEMSGITQILEKTHAEYGPVRSLLFFNYGDENAVMLVRGNIVNSFAHNYQIYYRVEDGEILDEVGLENKNSFKRGVDVIVSLHFGNFAGLDLRIIYFILGIAVAAMMVVGNVLWVNKRANNKNVSSRTTQFVSNMTIGSCIGFIAATAIAFLLERVLPPELVSRSLLVKQGFWVLFFMTAFGAYFVPNKKRFIAYGLILTAIITLTTFIIDWWFFHGQIVSLWQAGYQSVAGVNLSLGLTSILFICIATKLINEKVVTD